MEGLLPFLYRAILHYANGRQAPIGNPFLNESPSASPRSPYYVRLAGGADSGRLRFGEVPVFPSPASRDALLLELPVNVQKGLFKFLEQRGITLPTTHFMHHYMVTKQTQEYVQWMTKLKDFVWQ